MTNKFEIKVIEKEDEWIYFDFFVDGVRLSHKLGFDRLEYMGEFSDFDLDIGGADFLTNKAPDIKMAVEWFLGNKMPFNQFNSARAVLYRCFCGCDLCGVISCEIKFDGDFFYWNDIKIEGGVPNSEKGLNFKFDKTEYEEAFKEYMSEHIKGY
jgi:hypothetical protein